MKKLFQTKIFLIIESTFVFLYFLINLSFGYGLFNWVDDINQRPLPPSCIQADCVIISKAAIVHLDINYILALIFAVYLLFSLAYKIFIKPNQKLN